jgi:hypothetical protein
MHKIEVMAPLHTEATTLAKIADVLSLPEESLRQPDLQYLTAIFVSSGINKNGAVFLGSELVKARNTISNKAVDLEHDEQHVIGQITASAFLNRDRTMFDAETASIEMTTDQLDEVDMDIGITAIIHRKRFPEIATEVQEGKWMVSMEAFYRDYDIKVGDMIIPREKAEQLGFDRLVGSVVHLKDGDKEMGFHLVGRVLRDILFAGVGLVQNPANPRSVIMEAAALNEFVKEEATKKVIKIINIADIDVLETSIEQSSATVVDTEALGKLIKVAIQEAFNAERVGKEKSAQPLNDISPGTCLSYKRYIYQQSTPPIDEPAEDLTQIPLYNPPGPAGVEGPGATIIREHYCNLFDLDCSARPGNATMPECWRNVFARTMREEITNHEQVLQMKRVSVGLVGLQTLIDDAKKFVQ